MTYFYLSKYKGNDGINGKNGTVGVATDFLLRIDDDGLMVDLQSDGQPGYNGLGGGGGGSGGAGYRYLYLCFRYL